VYRRGVATSGDDLLDSRVCAGLLLEWLTMTVAPAAPRCLGDGRISRSTLTPRRNEVVKAAACGDNMSRGGEYMWSPREPRSHHRISFEKFERTRRDSAEQAIGFVVWTGAKIDRIGRHAGGAVAIDQLPQPIDYERAQQKALLGL
jgi:hypothetical protein